MQLLPNSDSPQPDDIEITAQQPLLATKVLIKRCSKCGIFSKLIQSFPPSRLDAWCDECFVNTPPIERTRKCSVGEQWKLIQKQKAKAKERLKLLKALEEAKLARAAEKKIAKKTCAARKSSQPEEAFSLPFDVAFLENHKISLENAEVAAQKAIADYDAKLKWITTMQDKTIYDEEYSDDS